MPTTYLQYILHKIGTTYEKKQEIYKKSRNRRKYRDVDLQGSQKYPAQFFFVIIDKLLASLIQHRHDVWCAGRISTSEELTPLKCIASGHPWTRCSTF